MEAIVDKTLCRLRLKLLVVYKIIELCSDSLMNESIPVEPDIALRGKELLINKLQK